MNGGTVGRCYANHKFLLKCFGVRDFFENGIKNGVATIIANHYGPLEFDSTFFFLFQTMNGLKVCLTKQYNQFDVPRL